MRAVCNSRLNLTLSYLLQPASSLSHSFDQMNYPQTKSNSKRNIKILSVAASSLSTEAEPLVLPTISNSNTTSKSAQEASRASRPPVSSRSTSTKCKCLYLATQMGSLSQ